jgi:ADP-dependent NAD(P)H-hydrate dehydratase / NAD(P)H-hydrate epimerase
MGCCFGLKISSLKSRREILNTISAGYISDVFHIIIVKFVKTPAVKVFGADKIREIDAITIRNEPVASIDLMERAAQCCTDWILAHIAVSEEISVFCGPGNNGGDGLAISRQLFKNGYRINVYLVSADKETSVEFKSNFNRLAQLGNIEIKYIKGTADIPSIRNGSVVIDSIFGSGLSRPVDGLTAELIKKINSAGPHVISIDIPSGLFCDDNRKNNPDNIIKATYTLTFQFPKQAFFYSENNVFTGEWCILPIGLDSDAIHTTPTPYFYTDAGYAAGLIRKRSKFSHKGTYGHGLLIAGSYGMMGAAILASRACMKSGVGLVTAHIPRSGCPILQTAVPESLVSLDESDTHFSKLPELSKFNAIAAGPAIGTDNQVINGIHTLLEKCKLPLVLDADALNIIADHKDWLDMIPQGSILTPHPKEFEKLFGNFENGYARNYAQMELSIKYSQFIVLKGAFTSISCPDGSCWFNSTGNPGMATGGSGDVLTGILLSLLAQNYAGKEAAILGTYIHGLAGDLACEEEGAEGVTASDIINHIGKAFKILNRIMTNNEK